MYVRTGWELIACSLRVNKKCCEKHRRAYWRTLKAPNYFMLQGCRSLLNSIMTTGGYTQSDEMTIIISAASVVRGEQQCHSHGGRVVKLCALMLRFRLIFLRMKLYWNNMWVLGVGQCAPYVEQIDGVRERERDRVERGMMAETYWNDSEYILILHLWWTCCSRLGSVSFWFAVLLVAVYSRLKHT